MFVERVHPLFCGIPGEDMWGSNNPSAIVTTLHLASAQTIKQVSPVGNPSIECYSDRLVVWLCLLGPV